MVARQYRKAYKSLKNVSGRPRPMRGLVQNILELGHSDRYFSASFRILSLVALRNSRLHRRGRLSPAAAAAAASTPHPRTRSHTLLRIRLHSWCCTVVGCVCPCWSVRASRSPRFRCSAVCSRRIASLSSSRTPTHPSSHLILHPIAFDEAPHPIYRVHIFRDKWIRELVGCVCLQPDFQRVRLTSFQRRRATAPIRFSAPFFFCRGGWWKSNMSAQQRQQRQRQQRQQL